MGMFPFMSPLQQHAQQFLQPLFFDGQPKNWPNFIRKWDEYVKIADATGGTSGLENSLVFKNYLPDNLKKEMESYMAQGHSFVKWINRLQVRYGNTSELERKQWYELRLETKGQVKVADWRSFMSVFTEYQLRVQATQDEAISVLQSAVPGFIQGWIKQFKVKKQYAEKKVHLHLGEGVPESEVMENLWSWIHVKPRHIWEIAPGVFEVSVGNTSQMEALLRLDGALVGADGRRAIAELPPQNLDLSELTDFVSEKFESQPVREVERSARQAVGDVDWSTQEEAIRAERENRMYRPRGRDSVRSGPPPQRARTNPPRPSPTQRHEVALSQDSSQQWAQERGTPGQPWAPSLPTRGQLGMPQRVQFKGPPGGYPPTDYDWYSVLRGINTPGKGKGKGKGGGKGMGGRGMENMTPVVNSSAAQAEQNPVSST